MSASLIFTQYQEKIVRDGIENKLTYPQIAQQLITEGYEFPDNLKETSWAVYLSKWATDHGLRRQERKSRVRVGNGTKGEGLNSPNQISVYMRLEMVKEMLNSNMPPKAKDMWIRKLYVP